MVESKATWSIDTMEPQETLVRNGASGSFVKRYTAPVFISRRSSQGNCIDVLVNNTTHNTRKQAIKQQSKIKAHLILFAKEFENDKK